MVQTFISFPTGEVSEMYVQIKINNELSSFIHEMINDNKIKVNNFMDDYILYSETAPKYNCQNSIFHNYIGNIVLTHKNKELNEKDISFIQTYCNNVITKQKRTFSEKPKKFKIQEVTKKMRSGLHIN